jgi:hypothetical protein
MIPIPSGVKVWIATGHTDMRRGMQSLALTVQESLKREERPFGLQTPLSEDSLLNAATNAGRAAKLGLLLRTERKSSDRVERYCS